MTHYNTVKKTKILSIYSTQRVFRLYAWNKSSPIAKLERGGLQEDFFKIMFKTERGSLDI